MTLQAAELFGCYDNDFIPVMRGDVLWPFPAHAANQLAKVSFGILQRPVAGQRRDV